VPEPRPSRAAKAGFLVLAVAALFLLFRFLPVACGSRRSRHMSGQGRSRRDFRPRLRGRVADPGGPAALMTLAAAPFTAFRRNPPRLGGVDDRCDARLSPRRGVLAGRVRKMAEGNARSRAHTCDRRTEPGSWRSSASPRLPLHGRELSLRLTPVRLSSYVLASWLAMLPGTLAYVYFAPPGRRAAKGAAGEGGPDRLGRRGRRHAPRRPVRGPAIRRAGIAAPRATKLLQRVAPAVSDADRRDVGDVVEENGCRPAVPFQSKPRGSVRCGSRPSAKAPEEEVAIRTGEPAVATMRRGRSATDEGARETAPRAGRRPTATRRRRCGVEVARTPAGAIDATSRSISSSAVAAPEPSRTRGVGVQVDPHAVRGAHDLGRLERPDHRAGPDGVDRLRASRPRAPRLLHAGARAARPRASPAASRPGFRALAVPNDVEAHGRILSAQGRRPDRRPQLRRLLRSAVRQNAGSPAVTRTSSSIRHRAPDTPRDVRLVGRRRGPARR